MGRGVKPPAGSKHGKEEVGCREEWSEVKARK